MMQKHHKEMNQPKHTEYIIAVTGVYPESIQKAVCLCVYTYVHTQPFDRLSSYALFNFILLLIHYVPGF